MTRGIIAGLVLGAAAIVIFKFVKPMLAPKLNINTQAPASPK